MTDDELDLLASAYVDGEATPEEVALVERDPELQARVEAFRAVEVDGSITPPSGLVDRHLAAAMAEFEAVAGESSASQAGPVAITGERDTAPVVDLRTAAARRSERKAAGPTSNGSTRAARQARTMPSWLPAAAGLVIIGGGLVWAIGQTGGDDDSSSDATEAAAIFEGEDESADDAGSDESVEESAEAEMATDGEAMEQSEAAMEEDADTSTRSEADAAGAAPADGDADEAADDAEAGFAVPEPLVFFDGVPDPVDLNELDDLPEAELNLDLSLCGPEIVTTTLGEPIGFIPVHVQGEPAELFLFLDGDGAEIRVLVDDNCLRLEP